MSLQNRSNTHQEEVVQYTHNAATTALTPLVINSTVVIPLNTAGANALNAYLRKGQISGAATANVTIAAFDKCYWDDTAKKFTNVSTSNTLCGRFDEGVSGGAASGLISFNSYAGG